MWARNPTKNLEAHFESLDAIADGLGRIAHGSRGRRGHRWPKPSMPGSEERGYAALARPPPGGTALKLQIFPSRRLRPGPLSGQNLRPHRQPADPDTDEATALIEKAGGRTTSSGQARMTDYLLAGEAGRIEVRRKAGKTRHPRSGTKAAFRELVGQSGRTLEASRAPALSCAAGARTSVRPVPGVRRRRRQRMKFEIPVVSASPKAERRPLMSVAST